MTKQAKNGHSNGHSNSRNTSSPATNKTLGGVRNPVVTVNNEDQEPDWSTTPAAEIDAGRQENYDAFTNLITATGSSRDSYSDSITDVNNAVIVALEDYVDNSPIVSAISEDLSSWLNNDKQTKINEYDSKISACESGREWV